MKKSLYISFALPILFLFWWQQSPEKEVKQATKEELIQAELQARIDRFTSNKLKNCRRAAFERAAQIVDSTLIARAKSERLNQLDRPDTPDKPNRPEKLMPKDTSALKPLIGG